MSFIPWWTLYPYVNDEAINLDWLLSKVTRDGEKLDDFITINSIKYADPILWDITSQYEANTITVDPQTGDAYISTKPVPYGTSLSNTDYWTKIYNYADAVNTLMEQIAIANERLSTTATATRSKGDLVWLNGQLYEVIAAMIAGDSYVENSNCIKTTVEEYINTRITAIIQTLAYMGNLANLNTSDKSTLVAAINEVLTTLGNVAGDLSNLNTTDKSNLVAAINEVLTTITTITGDLSNLNTTDKSNLVAAINEVRATITVITGNLANLSTTDKSTLVAAINELYQQVNPLYKRVLTVGTHGCDFTTINDAINEAKTYSSSTSRCAILVTGGTYYEEIDLTGNHGIDLIGIGMPHVVYSSSYPNAPLKANGKLYVHGMYFVNIDSSGSAYAFHYEGQSDGTSNVDVYISNCTFVSNANAALGFGSGIGTTARFENCYFLTNNSNVSPLYLHNRPQGSATLQSIDFISCEMRSAGTYSMLVDNSRAMQSGSVQSPIRLTFVGCSAGAGHDKVNFRYGTNQNSNFIPNTGEVYVSANSVNNDILGVNYGKQEFLNVTRSITMPYHADTSGSYSRCDFIVPFEATKYYRKINSITCNGVDVTASFSIENGNINTNKIGLVTTASNVLGRYIFVNMSFSLDPFN